MLLASMSLCLMTGCHQEEVTPEKPSATTLLSQQTLLKSTTKGPHPNLDFRYYYRGCKVYVEVFTININPCYGLYPTTLNLSGASGQRSIPNSRAECKPDGTTVWYFDDILGLEDFDIYDVVLTVQGVHHNIGRMMILYLYC